MRYKQLTLKERYQIAAYKKAGYLQKEIARELKVSESTISRELSRNTYIQHINQNLQRGLLIKGIEIKQKK